MKNREHGVMNFSLRTSGMLSTPLAYFSCTPVLNRKCVDRLSSVVGLDWMLGWRTLPDSRTSLVTPCKLPAGQARHPVAKVRGPSRPSQCCQIPFASGQPRRPARLSALAANASAVVGSGNDLRTRDLLARVVWPCQQVCHLAYATTEQCLRWALPVPLHVTAQSWVWRGVEGRRQSPPSSKSTNGCGSYTLLWLTCRSVIPFQLVGSAPELGGGHPDASPTLSWSQGDMWSTEVALGPGAYDFKPGHAVGGPGREPAAAGA
ncbi:hypothetical protein HaLaN_12676 [Haematococcus lacustris]|uniref:Uncharacterized protein n=1 Tax=Haematococcus lacustris TaxID=44745 RepID=A0A699ZAM6_HAELA|nr:hypothetical protein HaLaN_12676 [Haematococcus lacustris]